MVMSPQAQASDARNDALDLLVELLPDVDAAKPTRDFYDRICEAVCRLTSMERAVLFVYDEAVRWVRAAGSHGVDPALIADVHAMLEETPLAQRALSSEEVVVSSAPLDQEVPPRYARMLDVKTLSCTPVSAGGRWFGVILADRGGEPFDVTEEERHTMLSLGKMAALAAGVRMATRQQERARRLAERIELAREVHERAMQRLFGLSLVLGGDDELQKEDRRRCAEELGAALAELRSALERPLAPPERETATTLREELVRLDQRYRDLSITTEWPDGAEVPPDLEPLAQAVLAEALLNAHKHARGSNVRVRVESSADTFAMEVENDGLRESPPGGGLGLRLTAYQAVQHGGVVEFGKAPEDRWRVRLVVPRAAV
ncbi:MAG TPA: GAF domain-containing protein [Thermoleophilaceae bacterium]